jgi:alkanesulfonate monooxygenase SsuD/methylene tetrahydromethanopterin reductase-like flavin-dependent oxidoreductase (luciferase family)
MMRAAGVEDEERPQMEIGLGVDPGAGLSFPQHRDLARAAARLGYSDIWTPAGVGNDAFQICAQWWGASADVTPGGLTTGISVVPVPRANEWSSVTGG